MYGRNPDCLDVYDPDRGGGGGSATTYIEIYSAIQRHLTEKLWQLPPVQNMNYVVRLVGLIFAHNQHELLKTSILPYLDYWDKTSSSDSFFFCIGFSPDTSVAFKPDLFNQTVNYFESVTNWKYSGGTDLILLNGEYIRGTGSAGLALKPIMSLTLESEVKSGSVDFLPILFHTIMRVAREHDGNDPVSAVSDTFGAKGLLKTLKHLFTGLLPGKASEDADRAFSFAVQNIRAKDKESAKFSWPTEARPPSSSRSNLAE